MNLEEFKKTVMDYEKRIDQKEKEAHEIRQEAQKFLTEKTGLDFTKPVPFLAQLEAFERLSNGQA